VERSTAWCVCVLRSKHPVLVRARDFCVLCRPRLSQPIARTAAAPRQVVGLGTANGTMFGNTECARVWAARDGNRRSSIGDHRSEIIDRNQSHPLFRLLFFGPQHGGWRACTDAADPMGPSFLVRTHERCS